MLTLFTHTKKEKQRQMHPSGSHPSFRFVSCPTTESSSLRMSHQYLLQTTLIIKSPSHGSTHISIAARRLHGEELTKVAHEEHRADKHARASEEDHV